MFLGNPSTRSQIVMSDHAQPSHQIVMSEQKHGGSNLKNLAKL